MVSWNFHRTRVFSAVMSKSFKQIFSSKIIVTIPGNVFLQSETEAEIFQILKIKHHILLTQNKNSAPDQSLSSSPELNFSDISTKAKQKRARTYE